MEPLVIKASTAAEAQQIALEQLNDEHITVDRLVIEEMKSLLGFMKSTKQFKVTVKEISETKEPLVTDQPFNLEDHLDFSKIFTYEIKSYAAINKPQINLKYSSNKVKAIVDYYPPKCCVIDYSKIIFEQLLERENITVGVKSDVIKQLIETKEVAKNVVIAEGTPPEKGKDATLEYHFESHDNCVGSLREDGSMDFRNLHAVNNVEAGQRLVTLIEAEPGTDGIDVHGKTVNPPKPKTLKLPKGENTEIVDEQHLIASKEGHISRKNDKINVLQLYKVKGDVDFNTGNIDFVGNVFVEGNVTEGFEIIAGGDIHVRGNVEAAHLKSDGDILVNKTYLGHNKNKIECAGNFRARSVQNGAVKAKGDIIITDSVMHSKLTSHGKIKIEGQRGVVVGGTIRATTEVKANIIGSRMGTKTHIKVGVNPEIRFQIDTLADEIEEHKENYSKAIKAIELLDKIKSQKGTLSDDRQQMYKSLINTKTTLKKTIDDKQRTIDELTEELQGFNHGKVIASRKIFPGVHITINHRQITIDQLHNRASFKIKDGELTRYSV